LVAKVAVAPAGKAEVDRVAVALTLANVVVAT